MSGSYDVAIVGGCGHVGLPLALAFADRGLQVAIYDLNEQSVAAVNGANMPFDEPGAADVLQPRSSPTERCVASADPTVSVRPNTSSSSSVRRSTST